MYTTLKVLHLLGVVLLIGNVTATAVWKVFADRTHQPATIAFAQRLVTLTDWVLTGSGILLIMLGGYGMAYVSGSSTTDAVWLKWGQIMFLLSGAIWALVLLPIQSKQARIARDFAAGSTVPENYWQLSRLWLVWGIAATVPLVVAVTVMVGKF